MNLNQLLARVATGPSGGLAICGASSGVIPVEHVPNIVGKIQDTLTALHTRFPLQLKLLTIAVVDGLFEYPLRPEFAQSSGSAEINKFIVDAVGKEYTGDLIAIEHILAEDSSELPLNDRRDPLSWFTASYDTLSMAYPISGETYFVQYRANHAPLSIDYVDPDANPLVLSPATLNQKVYIPESLLPALLAKVAYECYCAQDGESAAVKEQQLLGKYEAICTELEYRNTLNSSEVTDRTDMIAANGWA